MPQFTVTGTAFYAKSFDLTVTATSEQQARAIVLHSTFDDEDGDYSLNEVCIQNVEQLDSPWDLSPQD